MREHDSASRGRHAPPLHVRQDRQRRRPYAAAAAVFASAGYDDATRAVLKPVAKRLVLMHAADATPA